MKPIETTITATTVRMRYADKSDAAAAMEWVDIQVKISDLQRSSGTPMGDTERLPVAEVRRAAAGSRFSGRLVIRGADLAICRRLQREHLGVEPVEGE